MEDRDISLGKSTFEQANYAKNKLRAMLQRPEWLRGTGISFDTLGYYIVVNISEVTSETKALPEIFEGVRVKTQVVGDIFAIRKEGE